MVQVIQRDPGSIFIQFVRERCEKFIPNIFRTSNLPTSLSEDEVKRGSGWVKMGFHVNSLPKDFADFSYFRAPPTRSLRE